MKFKPKPCRRCDKVFTPPSRTMMYCDTCYPIHRKERDDAKIERRQRKKLGDRYGVGKGGSNIKGKANPQYKNGISNYFRARREYPTTIRYCNRCNKDLLNVSPYERCVHHIDHDRNNNEDSNFEFLCKSCHQYHHLGCQEGATTIESASKDESE